MSEVTIKAITAWFGGKRTMAPAIVTELGEHGQYFEPMCGSMAVLFAKKPAQKETVNDLHGDLINLARCIQFEKTAVDLYDQLQRALVCEDLLTTAREKLSSLPAPSPTTADIERAYWYFLACWQGRNGTAGTRRADYQLAVRWTKGGGSPTVRWKHAVESIPWWHERLRNVVILCRDVFRIIDRFEDVKQTAIYVDPPYAPDSRSGYRKGPGSENKYLHEFDHSGGLFGDGHDKLHAMLSRYKKARIVVSYYDCPKIRELYRGWTIVEHTRYKHLHSQCGKGHKGKLAPEVLIMNGPSYAKQVLA